MINQAFPFVWHNPLTDKDEISLGMTLRDYFAVRAMEIALPEFYAQYPDNDWQEQAAKETYRIADAMMKAREE